MTKHFPIGSPEWKTLIKNGAQAILTSHASLLTPQLDHFAFHGLELLKWNRKMNLTAITDPTEVAVKHFLDSIAPAPLIPLKSSLLDLGSGGGFPGIPLKIVMPSLCVTLIDASRKKVSFQKHVIRSLGLRDIDAIHIRAEDLAKDPDYADGFDVIVCRALTSLDAFVRMALPLLKKHGMMIALKGKLSDAEIKSARAFQTSDASATSDVLKMAVRKYTLPYLDQERALVCLTFGSASP